MRLLEKIRGLFRRKQAEREITEELEDHLRQRIEYEKTRGLTTEQARSAALRAMEGLEQRKEEIREMRRIHFVEDFLQDIRYSLRTLSKSRAFSAVAILSLALGIGANAAIFSLMNILLLRPLPVPHAGRLVLIEAGDAPKPRFYLTYPLLEQIRDRNEVFSGVFSWSDHQFQLQTGAGMEHLNGTLASGAYFRTLGVAPEAGRIFTEDDDHPEGGKDGPVAVISDALWTSRFGRRPNIAGSSLVLDGIRFTIVGVMPAGFFGADPGARPQVWVPLTLRGVADPGCLASRSCWWLVPMARLKDGISMERANAQLAAISARIMRDTLPGWRSPLKEQYLAWKLKAAPGGNGWTVLRLQFKEPLAILMVLVCLVLLIACANLASLLLARAHSRQREIAVRMAMGAGRWRVLRQLFTESLLLASIGGAAGLAFAVWSSRLLANILASSQSVSNDQVNVRLDLSPDWRVVLFCFLVTVICAVLFGLSPALRSTRLNLSGALKERSQNLQGGARRRGLGRWILGFQAALSIVLVCAAGLFAGSLWRLLTLNPGFDTHNLLMISLDTWRRPAKGGTIADLCTRLLNRARSIPGVRTASAVWLRPLSNGGWNEEVVIPGRTDLTPDQRLTDMNVVGTDYFQAMQIPLLAGRDFTRSDSASSEPIGIINEVGARRFFPGRNPVGAQLEMEGHPLRIIGVAGSAKYMNLQEDDPPTLYFPFGRRDHLGSFNILLKTSGRQSGVPAAFRSILHEIAPDVPISSVKTMEQQVDDSLGSERLMAGLSLFFGVLALLITSVGLYGVLAYSVERRTGEIGIRMALGAGQSSVVLLIVREAVGHVVAGIAVGVVLVLMLAKLVTSLVYGIQPNDPGNLAIAVCIFLAVALAAAYLPARRAGSMDPLAALREE